MKEEKVKRRLYTLLWFVLPSQCRQGSALWVPLCRKGAQGTHHGFKSPRHPSCGEDANGGGAQWLQQPGFTPCVRGACGQLVKQLPLPQCQDCREGMEGTKRIVSAVQDADSPAWRNPVVFFNFSSSLSCHVNNSQCLEEKRVREAANYFVGVMESWRMLSVAGTAKHGCRHWKRVLS